MNHTSGPWLADSVHGCIVPGGMVSFRVRDSAGRGICCANSNIKRNPLEMAANAALVAAAPDMAAALAAIVKLMDGSQPRDYPGALMVAKSALAKVPA